MLKTIVSKELLDQMSSLRFITGLILSLVVTVTATVILTNNYEQEQDDYRMRISMQDDFLSNYAHTNRINPMIQPEKPPSRFKPLIMGLADDADLGSFDDNPLPLLFPPLDLIFIVTIIFSLMAILFGYDSICGEREKGTLRLMLSGNLSRAKLLLGKWLGGTLALTIPFILSLIIGLLYIIIHPSIMWSAGDWLTILLLVIASISYISLFYLLAITISSFSHSSSFSVLTSLFIWVLLVLAVPNLSPYLSAQFFHIPSVNRVEKEMNRLRGIERDELGRQMQQDLDQRYRREHPQFWNWYANASQDEIRKRVATDAQFAEQYQQYRNDESGVWREANRIQGEKAQVLRRDLEMKAGVQTWVAKHIACLSPYADFVYLATDLTGTGLEGNKNFRQQFGQYYQRFQEYLDGKVEEAQATDPTFNSNDFIDLSDRPRFSYKIESLSGRLATVLPYWGILLLCNIILYLLSFTVFQKYDIR